MAQRRRKYVGRSAIGRVPPSSQIYRYVRTKYYQNAVSVGTGANLSNAWAFRLSDMPGSADFTSLYDEYRIEKATIKFIPKFTQTNTVLGDPVANSLLTQFFTCIDYDDALALPVGTAIDDITQYQSCKMTRGNRVHTRYLVPKLELTAGGTSSAPKSLQWIDTDNASLIHNGVKYVAPILNGLPANTLLFWDVEVKLVIAFRNVI